MHRFTAFTEGKIDRPHPRLVSESTDQRDAADDLSIRDYLLT
jgi:hypothetical protein